MSVALAPQLTERSFYWTEWKALFTSKGGIHQHYENTDTYKIWFYDLPEVSSCTIWKGTLPESIVAGGYSQVQNDSDKSDFETNYKSTSNKRIQRTDSFGNPVQTPIEWASAFNLIPNVSVGRATGYTATSAASGKAIRATTYTPQGANVKRSLASSSANDAAAGTGARTVKITYLTAAFVLKTEIVTLNGTNAVDTVGDDLAFIESMEVMTVGTQGGGNIGTISLYTQIAKGGVVWASIAAGDNMTFWAHHYVPAGVTCYLLNLTGGATAVGGGMTVQHSNNPLDVNAPQKGLGGTYVHASVNSIDHWFRVPLAVPGPDLIWLVERPVAATASTVYGTFEYMQF